MGSERKRNTTASRSEVERFGAVAFLFIGCDISREDDREGGSRKVEGQRVEVEERVEGVPLHRSTSQTGRKVLENYGKYYRIFIDE